MATKKKADDMGGECLVVIGGRAFRCLMRNATMRSERPHVFDATSHFDSGPRSYLRGLESYSLSVDYDVLGEVDLTDAQAASIRATVDAGTPAPPGRRGISFGKV